MAIQATSQMRVSGMNSGLDTESIVNALTASTKLKITKNKRQILKLQAQQESYRTVIDKIKKFKDTYFDILNRDNYLKSPTTFSQFKATTSVNGVEQTPAGVKVTTAAGANPGNYNVTVIKKATQTTLTANSLDSKSSFTPGDYTNGQYAISVTAGGQTKQVVFSGSNLADANDAKDEVLANINAALKTAFGTTNDGKGRVSVDESATGTYGFKAADKSSVSIGNAVELKNSVELDGDKFKTGNNTLTVIIDGQEKSVSFSTIASDYFKEYFDKTTISATKQAELELARGAANWDAIKGDYLKDDGTMKGVFATEEQIDAWKEKGLKDAGFVYYEDGDYWGDKDGFSADPDDLLDAENAEVSKHVNALGFLIGADAAAAKADLADRKANLTAAINGEFMDKAHESYEAWATPANVGEHKGTKTESQMTDAQKALFEAEFARASLEQKQKAFDNSLMNAFDDWWEADMKAWNADPANAGNERDVTDYDYDAWLQGDSYTGSDYVQRVGTDFTDYEVSDNDPNFKADSDIFKSAFNKYEKNKLDKTLFMLGAYNEETAYANNYAGKAATDPITANVTAIDGKSKAEYIKSELAKAAADTALTAHYENFFNQSAVKNSLEHMTFENGTKLEVSGDASTGFTVKAYKIDTTAITSENPDGKVYVNFGISATENSSNFGVSESKKPTESVAVSTQLQNIAGLTADANGKFNVKINGTQFAFNKDATVSEMMSAINTSAAGVTMTFDTLNNTFKLTSKAYGTDSEITITDDKQGLFENFGFVNDVGDITATVVSGTNLQLDINNHRVETASNSYTLDGTTFTISDQAVEGTTFNTDVTKDNTKVMDSIRKFVEDYNELIAHVYGLVDEKKADGDFYFLADDDKTELELSESELNDWNTAAKKGLLYNDRTLQDVMGKFRTVLYSSSVTADGTSFALYNMGITTTSNYKEHGKLQIDEEKFAKAFEEHGDDIMRLFTDTENGLMTKFEQMIDQAIQTNGPNGSKGVLVEKAGMATGTSSTSNSIFLEIQRLNKSVASLQTRYDRQQDRYWKIYTAMETQMGQLNGQNQYLTQLQNM